MKTRTMRDDWRWIGVARRSDETEIASIIIIISSVDNKHYNNIGEWAGLEEILRLNEHVRHSLSLSLHTRPYTSAFGDGGGVGVVIHSILEY